MSASPPTPARPTPAARLGQCLLIALRLAIGWHLLAQGWEKIHSVDLGPTETNRPWSSRGFLLEAQGPLAPWLRQLAGDPDLVMQDLLRLPPSDVRQKAPAMPIKVEAIWDDYHRRLLSRYRFSKGQTAFLADVLKTHKDGFLRRPRPFTRRHPAGAIQMEMSLADQIEQYQKLRQELKLILERELPEFGKDVRRRQILELKAELGRQQMALLKQIAEATAALEQACAAAVARLGAAALPGDVAAAVLQPQGQIGPVALATSQALWAGPTFAAAKGPREEAPLASAIPADFPPSGWLAVVDFTVMWGLFGSGLLLLLGLFTRVASVVGGVILLLIYAAMMPLPGLAEPSFDVPARTLFVDQTLIEALALLALAALPTGRWLGLDALWPCLARWRRRAAEAPASAAEPGRAPRSAPAPKHRRYTGA
jgi:uncharacterized membrane protein YphA (DoxX/SURF4 family)